MKLPAWLEDSSAFRLVSSLFQLDKDWTARIVTAMLVMGWHGDSWARWTP